MSVRFDSNNISLVRFDGNPVSKFRIDGTVLFEGTVTLTFTKNDCIDTIKDSSNNEVSSLTVGIGTTLSASGNVLTVTDGISSAVTTLTATIKSTTAQYTYAFDSWNISSSTVNANTTLSVTGTKTLRSYSITFVAGTGATSVPTSPSGLFTYGTAITKNGTSVTINGTTYTGTVQSNTSTDPNAFVDDSGWSGPTTVTGDTTLTLSAQYTERKFQFAANDNPHDSNIDDCASWVTPHIVIQTFGMENAEIRNYSATNNSYTFTLYAHENGESTYSTITVTASMPTDWSRSAMSKTPTFYSTYDYSTSLTSIQNGRLSTQMTNTDDSLAVKWNYDIAWNQISSDQTKVTLEKDDAFHTVTFSRTIDSSKPALFVFDVGIKTVYLYTYNNNIVEVSDGSIGYVSYSDGTLTFTAKTTASLSSYRYVRLRSIYQPS